VRVILASIARPVKALEARTRKGKKKGFLSNTKRQKRESERRMVEIEFFFVVVGEREVAVKKAERQKVSCTFLLVRSTLWYAMRVLCRYFLRISLVPSKNQELCPNIMCICLNVSKEKLLAEFSTFQTPSACAFFLVKAHFFPVVPLLYDHKRVRE